MNIAALLRQTIKTCSISRYKIAQDTGLEAAALCRFMQGGSLKVETIDILFDYFGFEIKRKKPTQKAGEKWKKIAAHKTAKIIKPHYS
jgi:hypothetical protein